MWGWPSSCYRVQFNIPLNCSALSTKCEGTGKSSPGVHSSFSSPPLPSRATPRKKGEIHAAERNVSKPQFQSSQKISVLSVWCRSCNFAGLPAKKGEIHTKECVKVLAFRCQNFPFQQFPFPTVHRWKNERGRSCVTCYQFHFPHLITTINHHPKQCHHCLHSA